MKVSIPLTDTPKFIEPSPVHPQSIELTLSFVLGRQRFQVQERGLGIIESSSRTPHWELMSNRTHIL